MIASCKSSRIDSGHAKNSHETINSVSLEFDSIPNNVTDDIVNNVNSIENSNRVEIAQSLTPLDIYNRAYEKLEAMMEGEAPLNFKHAVFISENAFFNDSLSYQTYLDEITSLADIGHMLLSSIKLNGYKKADSLNVIKNNVIFLLMKDTLWLTSHRRILPYEYDFTEFFGEKDHSRMFVTKLLDTEKGNCHSLPYLYKILAEEFNAKCWLSLAPNHIYIKNRCKQLGWYNTELTSGTFPTDAWIAASGYVMLEAIQNGVFMDTLSLKQSIGLTIYDLAKGYERKTKNYSDGFIVKCCNIVLKHHSNNVNAMILKAEVLKKQLEIFTINSGKTEIKEILHIDEAKRKYAAMKELYVRALKLGYREIPEKMYLQWLASVKDQEKEFADKKIEQPLKTHN